MNNKVIIELVGAMDCFLIYEEFGDLKCYESESSESHSVVVVTDKKMISQLLSDSSVLWKIIIDTSKIKRLCEYHEGAISHRLAWEFHNYCIIELIMRGILPMSLSDEMDCYGELSSVWSKLLSDHIEEFKKTTTDSLKIDERLSGMLEEVMLTPSSALKNYICMAYEILRQEVQLNAREMGELGAYCLIGRHFSKAQR